MMYRIIHFIKYHIENIIPFKPRTIGFWLRYPDEEYHLYTIVRNEFGWTTKYIDAKKTYKSIEEELYLCKLVRNLGGRKYREFSLTNLFICKEKVARNDIEKIYKSSAK